MVNVRSFDRFQRMVGARLDPVMMEINTMV